MKNISIAHLTSVHPRFDTRIFYKECRSLAAAGYEVSLIVADGEGDKDIDGVKILDVGKTAGRAQRILNTSRRVMKRALELNAEIYHLHDPELLTIAGRLGSGGKIVIFDSHEDVPVQILGKPYLHSAVRWFLSRAIAKYETWICRSLDAVVTATPFIRDKFLKINPRTIDINNFPILGELASSGIDRAEATGKVCYIGGVSLNRGIREMVSALDLVERDVKLVLCGKFEDEATRAEVEDYTGWNRVIELGWVGRDEVRRVLNESVAGLVTLQPLQNYLDSLPIKMFEYMSAGVPVIASDFPFWREIIEDADCGICVDPKDPRAIAEAIDFLVGNSSRAREMGVHGQEAVQNRYNWSVEERKLVDLYEQLLYYKKSSIMGRSGIRQEAKGHDKL